MLATSLRTAVTLVFFLGTAVPAFAQQPPPYDPSYDLEFFRGAVAAPSQIIGKGGAVIGLAVGSAMIMDNPAAIGNRYTHEIDHYFEFDGTLNWLNQNVGDLENRGGVTAGHTGVLNLATHLNFGRFGIGFTATGQATEFCLDGATRDCAPEDRLELSAIFGGFALGHVFIDDQIIFGAWLAGGAASVGTSATPDVATYRGAGVVFGTLWRPHDMPFRVGSTFRTPMTLTASDGNPTQVGSLLLPQRVTTPLEWSIGVAYMWGPRPFNPRPTFGDGRMKLMAENRPEYARRYLLLTGDYVIAGPSVGEQSVGVSSWLEQTATPVGQSFSTTVRLGLESEFWPNRMVGRVGTYYEPNRYAAFSGRFHFTSGVDVHLFRALWTDWRLTGAMDVAPHYLKTGLAIGFWN